jgi:hypothetical protein
MNISISSNGGGQLQDYLSATRLYVSGALDILGGVAVKSIGGPYNLNLPLDAGKSKNILLDWYVNGGYTPAEGDIVTVTIIFSIQPAP